MLNREKITIVIPTMNRADFLRRLLHYFVGANFQGWIFIGDSSSEAQMDETKKTIKSLGGSLKIKYFECPGLSDVGAIMHINQSVVTPYCAFLADDDFLCVNGINKCIAFLESNPDYGAAHGKGIATRIDRDGPYGHVSQVQVYEQTVLDANSGSQRLRDYYASGPYALIFSVHRSQDWRDMFEGFDSSQWARQGFIFGELIPSSISAVRNKVKELDCLYLVRFGHEGIYSQVHVYDWFTSPDWFPGFKAWHDRAIEELIRQDGISKEAAEEVFKKAISPYLGRLFSRLLPQATPTHKPGIIPRLMEFGGHIPGLQVAYHKIMPRFRAQDEANLLPSLLRTSLPYHHDFMPIYRAITTPVGEDSN